MSKTHSGADDAIVQEATPAKLDLSRYRSRGLFENVVELISVPHALRRVVTTTFVLLIAVLVTVGVIFYEAAISGSIWLLVCAYSLFIGLVLGVMLGLLRVLSRALANIETLLKITLDITELAAEDYANLQSGATCLPSAGELVEQVHEEVLLPTMEDAVSESFGVIARPILWLYRRSIGIAVSYVTKRLPRAPVFKEQEATTIENVEQSIGFLARYPEQMRSYTQRAVELVHNVSRRLRFYATLPLYVVFSATLFVACVPILVLRFLATGEPQE